MKSCKTAWAITHQNFSRWKNNDRILALFGVCIFLVFFYLGKIPFYNLRTNNDCTPFLLPFLFTVGYNANGSSKILLLFGIIVLFSDAPFLNTHKVYLILRSKRKAWWLGEVFYIFFASLVYMSLLALCTILLSLPHPTLSSWGKTAITANFGSLQAKASIWTGIAEDPVLITQISPFPAFLYTFITGWLVFVWLGLWIDWINLSTRKNWPGIASAGLIVLIEPVLHWIGQPVDPLYLLTPGTWCTITSLRQYSGHGPLSLPVVFILLCGEILLLLILTAHRSRTIDIAEWQE